MTAPYIRHESSPFQKRILIPFWILRGLVLIVGTFIYSLVLASFIAFNDQLEEFEREENVSLNLPAARAVAGVIVALFGLACILEIVCFIKRGRRTLSPLFFLLVNILDSAFMIFIFILTFYGERTPRTIGVAVAELIVFLGFLAYSAIIFHKFRKGRLTPDIEHTKAAQFVPQ
ncbi:hypothetical protein OQA88_9694 [Cercophora sp. LCS_1]